MTLRRSTFLNYRRQDCRDCHLRPMRTNENSRYRNYENLTPMKKMSGNGRAAEWTPGSSARHDRKMPKYREYSPVASPMKFRDNEGYAEEEEEDPIKAPVQHRELARGLG